MRGPRIDHYQELERAVEASRPFNDTISEVSTFILWGMRDERADGYEQALRDVMGMMSNNELLIENIPIGVSVVTVSQVRELACEKGISLEEDV